MPSVYSLIVWNLLRERLELNGTKLNTFVLFLYYFGKYFKFVW